MGKLDVFVPELKDVRSVHFVLGNHVLFDLKLLCYDTNLLSYKIERTNVYVNEVNFGTKWKMEYFLEQ